MATTNDIILKRIESMEAELAQLKRALSPDAPAASTPSLRGIWKDVSFTNEEIEAVTHPERRIRALEKENLRLKEELERLRTEPRS